MNHEAVISLLAKAISDIADELPRIQLTAKLYASQDMKETVTKLYAHIIRFFLRAHDWYRERPIWHVVHSFTRPAELRYNDLIEKIKDCSRAIDRLAVLGQQIEQRAIHEKVDAIEMAICLFCKYMLLKLACVRHD